MPVNFYDEFDVAGKEISSTYEGRHITLPESLLIHPAHDDGFVDKGDPIVSVNGDIVGVALLSAAAATDQISIDTEGIWALEVVAEDQDGASAIAVGDEIFINTSDGILSKNYDKNTQQHFGYALMSAAVTDVIAVKVHQDPDYPEEQVGSEAVPYVMGAETIAREYRYSTALTSGMCRAMYVELDLLGAGISADALRPRVMVGEVAVAGAYGIHAGVEFSGDTLGRITGLSAGGRFTYFANNRGQTGTVCGGMSELYADGTSTDFGTAMHSIHRFVMDGDATGKATADNVFEFAGLSAVQYAANSDTADYALRCIINGNVRYIKVAEATA